MAIVIKELLASDTLSDAADKINFNFDQLLLNGGGPVGPFGPQGPIGPIGGRGIRGSQWFEDPTVSPGTNPNSLTFVDVEEGDNYLQSDGTVWEWNGTVWVATSVNLTGPQGAAGTSGLLRFGSPINNQQSIYLSPMPGGTSAGADNINEAVPTLVVGGFVSITPLTAGITYQESLINDVMATSIDSTNSAILVHQLNSSSTAIRFMGGNNGSDNYEQTVLSNLASISLIQDDRLRIEVPKAPINSGSLLNLSGYIVDTIESGQYYLSGKHINFITGQSTNSSGSAFENSDFSVEVNRSIGTNSNPRIRLNVTSLGGSQAASIDIGSNTAIPSSTANTGSIIAQGGLIGLVGSSTISLITTSNITHQATGSISLNSGAAISATSTGNISLATTNGNISINAVGTGRTISLATSDGNISINAVGTGRTISLATSDGNISINAVGVTRNITTTAGNNITTTADNILTITADSASQTQAAGNLRILANTLSSDTPDIGLYNAEVPTGPSAIAGTVRPLIRVRIRGNNHIRHRSNAFGDNDIQLLTPKDDFILLSGNFRVVGDGTTGAAGFGTATTMSWMRIGKVVHVSGRGFAPTCTGNTLTIPVPVVTSDDDISLDSSFGIDPRGTCIITTGGGGPATTVGVVEGSGGTDFNIVKRNMSGAFTNWTSDDVYTFTFTFTLNGG